MLMFISKYNRKEGVRMKEKEIWKDIPEYEGYYQASSLGRVRSVDRTITRKDGVIVNYKGKLISPVKNSRTKRLQLNLMRNGKLKTYYVHYLVAAAFIGKRPEGLDVLHADGDCLNNKSDNLSYDTETQNHIDCYRYGKTTTTGRLSVEDVVKIRRLYDNKQYKQRELAEMFNVGRSNIGHIVNRRSYKFINEDGTIDESKTKVN